GCDGLLLLAGHGIPAGVGLLDGIFGLGQRAEEPVGEGDQLTPLTHDRVQARAGPAVSPHGLRGHGAAGSPCRICTYPVDKTAHRNVRPARRLTFHWVALSYCREEHISRRAGSPVTSRRFSVPRSRLVVTVRGPGNADPALPAPTALYQLPAQETP